MRAVVVAVALLVLMPMTVVAQDQSDYGTRLQSKDGRWMLPVATRINGSDEEKHTGRGSVLAWDLVAPLNSPVYAMGPGKVEYAGCNNDGGYGCWLLINHGEFKAIYGHMVTGSIPVKAGQQVDANTVIGKVGRTGMTSFGPHTHLEMHKIGGGRFRIDYWFDRSGMRFCSLCSVSGEPAVWSGDTRQAVVANVQVPTRPVAATTATIRLTRMMSNVGPDKMASLAVVVFFMLCSMWWFGGLYSRVFVIAFGTSVVVASYAVWLVMPVGSQPVQAVQQPVQATQVGTEAFETALKVTLKREGSGCDTYIVRTLNGVTQWTYDRYRKAKGLPKADVCSSLTEAEWRYIYYNYYWLPSGANALPINAAIPVFDHYVNAGRKITGCGTDTKCVNQQRLKFYLSTSDCARKTQVCRAWLDRVEYIRQLTEGKQL